MASPEAAPPSLGAERRGGEGQARAGQRHLQGKPLHQASHPSRGPPNPRDPALPPGSSVTCPERTTREGLREVAALFLGPPEHSHHAVATLSLGLRGRTPGPGMTPSCVTAWTPGATGSSGWRVPLGPAGGSVSPTHPRGLTFGPFPQSTNRCWPLFWGCWGWNLVLTEASLLPRPPPLGVGFVRDSQPAPDAWSASSALDRL